MKKEFAPDVEKKSIGQEQPNIVVNALMKGFTSVGFKNQGQGFQVNM